MTPEKMNRRALRHDMQKKIIKALSHKKYATRIGVVLFSTSQIKAMAKQMAQGRHPAMGINW